MTVLRRRTANAWQTLSGGAQLAVPPGLTGTFGVVTSTGQMQVSWLPPFNGGSPLSGYTVSVTPTAGGPITSVNVAPNVTTATITGLSNGTPYNVTVTATNAAGSTTGPLQAVTIPGSTRVRPNVSTTGVPIGLAGDTRPPEALTPVTGVVNGRKDIAGPVTFDHVDFTDVFTTIRDGVSGVIFNRCYFKQHVGGKRALPQTLGHVDNLQFNECTIDGHTDDPLWPAPMLSVAGSTSAPPRLTNLVYHKCHFFGTGDAMTLSFLDGFLIEENYVHDLQIDKHLDEFNHAKWGHSDCIQFGKTDYVRNGLVQFNSLEAWSPLQTEGNAIIQGGAMNAGAQIENFRFADNWVDGGQYMFQMYTDITIVGYYEMLRNQFGLRQRFGTNTSAYRNKCTAWSDNIWMTDGVNKDGAGIQVFAGQLIP